MGDVASRPRTGLQRSAVADGAPVEAAMDVGDQRVEAVLIAEDAQHAIGKAQARQRRESPRDASRPRQSLRRPGERRSGRGRASPWGS